MVEAKVTLVNWRPLDQWTSQVFTRLGLSPEHAQQLADTLTQANLRGIDTHGVDLIPAYYRRIRSGAINPQPHIRVLRESPAMLLADGDAGPGQVVSIWGMNRAMEKARQVGVGWVSIRNSSHQGALAYYPLMAAEQGMLGMATTNTPPVMAPWGGVNKVIGNNPVAVAVPTAKHRPLVLDMACSVLANGYVRLALERGEPVPEGLALDRYGNPTLDPQEARSHGSVLPAGTYKGYGLAVVMEILAGALSGAAVLTGIAGGNFANRDQQPWDVGHLLLAVDIAFFRDPGEFKEVVDGVIEDLKASPRRPRVEEIFVPGEIEWDRVPSREREGIPVHATLLHELREIADVLELPLPAK